MKVKFEVPFNGDVRLIEAYKEHKDRIFAVYGRAEDSYPQGRNTSKTEPISMRKITEITTDLEKKGIGFNYLLNGNCHGNREFNQSYRRKFINFVKELKSRGIYGVTISNLFLMETVRENVPDIKIFASVLLEIDNLTRLEQINKAGAGYVTLSKTLLKNFEGLKNIVKFKPKETKLILLANDPCLHNCTYTNYHNNVLSHFTSEGGEYVNYCRLHCNQEFAKDSRKVISASFIRPEDIGAYRNIGFDLFKLCERKQTTPWNINVLEAYVQGSYDGNLADLMAPWSNIGSKYPSSEVISKEDLREKGFDRLRHNLRFEPSINNKALDGYLYFWTEVKRNGCANESCDACNYCSEIAKKAYLPNEDRNSKIVENTDIALKFARGI